MDMRLRPAWHDLDLHRLAIAASYVNKFGHLVVELLGSDTFSFMKKP